MTAVVIGGLRMRKLRAVLTALAVVLGVAMISGTYVLVDTTTHGFDSVFATAYSKADAVVVGRSPISGPSVSAPPVPASVVARIRGLPQVQGVQGFIQDTRAQLRTAHGGAITGTTVVVGAPGGNSAFYVTQVVAGRRPTGPGEIALDEQTAQSNHLAVGSTVGLVSLHPLERFRVVGIVRYGGVAALGFHLVALDLPVAQQLFNKQGLYDTIYVSSRTGMSSQQLVRAIAPVLPAAAQVKTRAQQVQSRANDVAQAFSILRIVLLVFGGIALFVGSFVIFNTLWVTVAQRTREFATLRTIGASRKQVLGSVVVEGLLIGILGSVIGLVAGLGLAKGLQALISAGGTKLPSAGTVLATRTVIVSLAAGIIVTLVASLVPAVRATRVPPIAAVREGAILPPGRLARAGKPLLVAVGVAGAALLGLGLFASGLATTARLLMMAGGATLLFVGLTFVSQWLIAPLAQVIGRPFVRTAGATGELARENTSRNPARTAITAGALTVGVAVVAFIAVLGAELRTTTNNSIKQQLTADYVIGTTNGTPLPVAVGDKLRSTPGITATAVRYGQIKTFGKTEWISGIDPATAAHFYNFKWTAGSGTSDLAALDRSGAIISQQFADDHHLSIGSALRFETQSGTKLNLTVRGIHQLPAVSGLLGPVLISTTLFDRSFAEPGDEGVAVDTAGGASSAAQRSLTKLVAGFPDAKVQTVAAYIKGQQTAITAVLNDFYVLLVLAIVVSLFGIVNTLVLSIVERTREIGALRAMGMTRRQLKRMIRIESQITALIGAVIGIIVGVALAGLTTAALSSWSLTFTVPVSTLLGMIVLAFFAGRLASRWPARRAAHLNPLQALQYE